MKPALLIFTKQPVPGKVKTRLAEHCGYEIAANIATVLLTETISLAVREWSGPVYLYCWPDKKFALFEQLADEHDFILENQSTGTLGDKMYTALKQGISKHGAAAVMGTDVPHCPKGLLTEAYTLLEENKSVIGPAKDGGYYFIGLQKPDKELFSDITWGQDKVFNETIKRAKALGTNFEQLVTLQDIDDWHDFVAAAEDMEKLNKFL